MKTKIILIGLFVFLTIKPMYSQIYSPIDSAALRAIDADCDAHNKLNWDTETNLANWIGVTWNNSTPKRVNALEINDDSLTGIMDVSSLTNLIYLYCYDNQLTGLNLSGLNDLTNLYCYSNQLTSLDVSTLTNLSNLYCGTNQLTNLDVTALTNLTILECDDNQLTSLDLSGLTNLGLLLCSSNKSLASLNVSGLTNLTTLACNDNKLISLDLTSLTNLTNLICDYNQLTNLDITGLSKLATLYCNNNQLTSLNVSSLINLKNLNCYNNQLTSLDVSSLTSLTNLSCYHNKLPFSSLATGLNVGTYNYIPQDTIFAPFTLAGTYAINYSTEALIKDSISTFGFYKNGAIVDADSTGLFTTTGPGVYYCIMYNSRFPGLILTTAKITISGETPALSVLPSTLDIQDTANSTGIIKVTSNTAWSVSSSEAWLALSDTSGMLNDSVIVNATANQDTTIRSAIVTFSAAGVIDQTVTVTQEAKPYLLVSKPVLLINATTAIFNIISNTTWTINSSETWLTANPASGSNSHTITLTAEANPSSSQRIAEVTISGTGVLSNIISVTQAGTAPSEISQAAVEDVNIFPCPVIDKVKVRLSQSELPSEISIYSIDGKQLALQKTTSTLNEIDMTKFKSGIYILRIMMSGNIIEKKMIKQ